MSVFSFVPPVPPWDAAVFHVSSTFCLRHFSTFCPGLLFVRFMQKPTSFCTHNVLHQAIFAETHFYTNSLLQTTFYILLHQPALTQTCFYTNQLLSKLIVRPTSFYTNHLCNQLLQTSFYTNQLLPYFTQKHFYTNIRAWSFRQTAFNANHLLHRPAFTTQLLRGEQLFRQTNLLHQAALHNPCFGPVGHCGQMAGGFPVCTQLERSPAQQPTKSLAPLPASRCQRAGRRQCEHPDA